jgi:hypothetical protein
MQHGDLDKTKVLKTQRDSMSDVSKPNSKSVLKFVIPVRLVMNTGQTDWTHPRASPSTRLIQSVYWLPEPFAGHVWYWTRLAR